MKIVRLIAQAIHENPFQENKGYSFFLLCGLNDKNELEAGEWMGYMKQNGFIYPFVLQDGKKLIYGGIEGLQSMQHLERTNIQSKMVLPDEYFTVNADDWVITFKIKSVHSF